LQSTNSAGVGERGFFHKFACLGSELWWRSGLNIPQTYASNFALAWWEPQLSSRVERECVGNLRHEAISKAECKRWGDVETVYGVLYTSIFVQGQWQIWLRLTHADAGSVALVFDFKFPRWICRRIALQKTAASNGFICIAEGIATRSP